MTMGRARILLVTNIPDHAVSYEAAFSERGYNIRVAAAGADAMHLAREATPDCFVIDVRLPDMSGWDLCRDLKQQTQTRAVPVVVLTPDTSQAHARDSERVQCTAWITLPSQADDLVRAVDYVLAQDDPAPRSPEEAVLGVSKCLVCDSDRVRATLRVSPIQYYRCAACGYSWRVEAL
jgi:DNA-binding response OmpR family regulator